MKTLGLLAAILVCVMFSARAAESGDKKECKLTRLASLPIRTLEDGRFAVPVAIDGHTLSFLVDTGGNTATLEQTLAQQFNLPVKLTSRSLLGVAGAKMNSYVTPAQFSLGGMTGANLPFYLEVRGMQDVDGTLAPDMMQGYDVDIDFAKGNMNLFSQDHCRGAVVYWTRTGYVRVPMDLDRTGHIRIPVTIDGKKTMAAIDTGADTSLMSMRTASDLGISETSPDLKVKEESAHYKLYAYPFHTLDFDGISVTNPHIVISSDSFMQGLGSDVILGVGILRQLHIYIAYGEERLYITPAEAN